MGPWEQLGGGAEARGSSSWSSSEGLGRQLHGEVAAQLGTRILSTSSEKQGAGKQPRIWPPPGQAEARRAQDSKDAPAKSSADQQPHPRPPGPANGLLWSYCGG